MCRHLIVPIFVPGRTATNDTYRPAVLCVRCAKEFPPKERLEEALSGMVARGMGPGLVARVREQFRWYAEGSKS